MSLPFSSRRSTVICQHGCVASSQPLATQIGIDILKSGGNAADAAVAVAAALNVTEPCSTGIGGDAFCLFYDANTKRVSGLNGSGRAPANLTLDLVHRKGFNKENLFPDTHGHAVTVPGAAAAWVDTVEKFGSGKVSLSEILRPAAELAEVGFPVQKIAANSWRKGSYLLSDPKNKHGCDMLLNGKPPCHGQMMQMPHLAKVFKDLGVHGKSSFYSGRVAMALADVVQTHGGVMSLADLENHVTTFDEPICVDYKGYRLWEIPPNGQGITALIALNIIEQYQNMERSLKDMGHNSADYIHMLTEALKLSFADTTWYCADPGQVKVPVTKLLSKEYAVKRAQMIQKNCALKNVTKGDFTIGDDTVYFTTSDKDGNACSFINSNFMGFGTGLVPEGCGFTLQNRGCGFSLERGHPNAVAPCKRPYHTIIPAMVTHVADDSLMMSYGCMGGFMQPQGHVQVLLNMVEFGLDPQEAVDQPRICVGGGYGFDSRYVSLEEGIEEGVVSKLKELGHSVDGPLKNFDRSKFGKAQVIQRREAGNGKFAYWGGSDPRGDGMVIGY
ncbi:hypothetical protein FSP39_021884 [Pinctada imbricata]|uniref:Gamma-glutamyltransferase n=1 Tax=Pinctada imbricata TaxID=66713 RepID=A0AA89BUT5_PINIB|nr:hypothetical protein FSP39_021884 [Pinctada imbricata]